MSEKRTEGPAPRNTDVSRLKLERRPDGQIWTWRDGGDVVVQALPYFPWTYTGRYVSLRDADGKELVMIRELGELDEDVRRLVEEALAETGFVLEITRVESVQTEYEIRNWKVQTRQGPFTFQTKLDDWPHLLPDGGVLFRDVAGNLFRVRDPHALDAASRKLIWPFVD